MSYALAARSVVVEDRASSIERRAVARLWQNLETMMLCDTKDVDQFIMLLQTTLPALEEIGSAQLPHLARLHLSSGENMMATVRLLAPSAFRDGSKIPDEEMLDRLDSNRLGMVSCLISLQMFHLQRAAVLSRHYRMRLRQRPVQYEPSRHEGWLSSDAESDKSCSTQPPAEL